MSELNQVLGTKKHKNPDILKQMLAHKHDLEKFDQAAKYKAQSSE